MAGDGAAELVTYEREGEVALVGLNRPEKRNAIGDRLLAALEAALRRAASEAKAGVLFGHGGHFSAGLDLAEHAGRSLFEGIRNSREWHRVFGLVEFGEIPWVAALHGAVVGGGLELAAAAQIRVADATAFFALPEGQRGIFVGGGGSVRIARLCGTARMADMMLAGRVASAEEAERWNLVQYLVPAGAARAKALELAARAAGNAGISNWAVIQALPRIRDIGRDEGLLLESLMASVASASPEAGARLRDFLEKRAARLGPPAGG